MNIEFKGTEGPWEFFEVDDGIGVVSPHADVAHCMGFDSNRSISEERANAKLIAAAPKLLEALKRMLDLECPLTGNPTRAELIEHWEYEQSQGNGAAEYHLFAWGVIAEALGDES